MKNRYFVSAIVILLLLLAACSSPMNAGKAYKRNAAHAPYDVIIVPGYQYLPGDTGRNATLFRMRIYWAKTLYDQGVTRNIIFSGAAVHSAYEEGKLMKYVAQTLGVPAEHIYVEDKALHSITNLSYGRKMAHKLGFKKIAIATDAWQFSYLPAFKWLTAPGAKMLPLSIDSARQYSRPLPYFDTKDYFIKDFVPLEKR